MVFQHYTLAYEAAVQFSGGEGGDVPLQLQHTIDGCHLLQVHGHNLWATLLRCTRHSTHTRSVYVWGGSNGGGDG